MDQTKANLLPVSESTPAHRIYSRTESTPASFPLPSSESTPTANLLPLANLLPQPNLLEIANLLPPEIANCQIYSYVMSGQKLVPYFILDIENKPIESGYSPLILETQQRPWGPSRATNTARITVIIRCWQAHLQIQLIPSLACPQTVPTTLQPF